MYELNERVLYFMLRLSLSKFTRYIIDWWDFPLQVIWAFSCYRVVFKQTRKWNKIGTEFDFEDIYWSRNLHNMRDSVFNFQWDYFKWFDIMFRLIFNVKTFVILNKICVLTVFFFQNYTFIFILPMWHLKSTVYILVIWSSQYLFIRQEVTIYILGSFSERGLFKEHCDEKLKGKHWHWKIVHTLCHGRLIINQIVIIKLFIRNFNSRTI